jgi:hypothetical protein
MRLSRWCDFMRRFPVIADIRVLDLGGAPEFRRAVPLRPRVVTTVNIASADPHEDWIDHVVADACEFRATGPDDLVVSSSLLEDIGGRELGRRPAGVVHASAPAHWVQTLYRYFPVEPHWLALRCQLLPTPARAAVLCWRLCRVGGIRNRGDALRIVRTTEPVSFAETRLLFPGSMIWREGPRGLAKSLVTVRA